MNLKLEQWRKNPVRYVEETIGIKPNPDQKQILMAIADSRAVSIKSGHGVGKAIGLNTIIPTPSGSVKWGTLQKGNKVFAEDGSITAIRRTFDHRNKDMYWVYFDDGTNILVCEDHLWKVKGRQERRKDLGWTVMSTKDIINKGVLRSNGISKAKQWEIPIQGATQFPYRDIPVTPYLFGVWLGDGVRMTSSYCKPYLEVENRINTEGNICKRSERDTDRVYVENLVKGLSKVGVADLYCYEKYVPDLYKYNSIEIRKAVLEGLLDTDGECDRNGSIIFSSTSKRLAEDVMWLSRSIGGKASLQPTVKNPFYYSLDREKIQGRKCYRVTVSLTFNPFSIKHKAVRWHPIQDRYLKRWISKIEYSGKEDAMCIEVDHPSHCYLANDFIVTHNTTSLAWAILWFLTCYTNCRIPCTAPTADQLIRVLWPEIDKWRTRSILKDFIVWQKEKVFIKGEEQQSFAYYKTARTPEALAGIHEDNIMYVMDEASGIEDVIWEPVEGALTSGNAKVIATSNPTKPEGNFYRTFTDQSKFWKNLTFSCLNSKQVTKEYCERQKQKYGEDSDVYRVRVLGEFPRQASDAFIPLYLCEQSLQAEVGDKPRLRMGVDVARFGSNYTVWLIRGGGKIKYVEKKQTMDTMQVAGRTRDLMRLYNITSEEVYIDSVGVGGGVVDRLVELGDYVNSVNSGLPPMQPDLYVNKRVEMWAKIKDELTLKQLNLSVENDPDLTDDLCGELASPHYKFTSKGQKQLEGKEDMVKRGIQSPDIADALALTYASGNDEAFIVESGRSLQQYPKNY